MARRGQTVTPCWLLAAVLLNGTGPVRAAEIDRVEMSIQAAYLYQFTRFVEWPSADPADPLVVCVVGQEALGEALDLAVQGRRVGARLIAVRRLADAEEAAACNVVYLPAGEAGRLPELQRTVRNEPVLLVSDAPRFASNGGMIGFFREADRVRFEVNPQVAEAVGLRISSRLLGIARVVGGGRDGGSGR